ncbi:conserved hypothetical protein [Vibrio harveyi]|uniref:hypothetical protein n=1 Tax=Vibrio harveyi TaxID=669 RepID=UPI001EFDED26|nr:hypothetical protein [Vibrio harveyi]MCG9232815.1 hypothetical protein [Vibrio harveyi]MCG9588589.1 hypothetical protein [Vibrio harveyi]CAH1229298.1 conserved hypothetical protein [Vibrio harveyi]CAH1578017.1 conserved hypothetical protein [Vibrio harveyi]CAH1587075.1 conserved hypothetical protein [Vibrio harveyi]
MAKSPIASVKKSTTPPPLPSNGVAVEELDMIVALNNQLGVGSATTTINLRRLCHKQCDPSQELAIPCRRKMVKKFYKDILQRMKDGMSHATLKRQIGVFNAYLRGSDNLNVDPFSEDGYKAMHNANWEKVAAATETKKYIFQNEDGEQLGNKEGTAQGVKVVLDSILNKIGFDVGRFQSSLKQFRKDNRNTTVPYKPNEWQTMLRRLNYYFTNLATRLIAYKDANPSLPPPDAFKDVVIDVVDGKEITIDLKSIISNGSIAGTSPFNQAMASGYLLFAYYTAFNTTSILDVRHPINIIKEERAGRTSRTVKVKGYKGRSNSEVRALFESLDESLHVASNDATEGAGIIVADIDKRDTNGIEDGVTFIEILSTLSEIYSTEEFGRLFYLYTSSGVGLFVDDIIPSVAMNLGLYSSSRYGLSDYFIKLFYDLYSGNTYPLYSVVNTPDRGKVVNKSLVEPPTGVSLTRRLRSMMFGAIQCLTDIELKGIIMPLEYGEPDDDGNMKVRFKYYDGRDGDFVVPIQYKEFLKKVEAYSNTFNPIPSPKDANGYGSISNKAPYLLPMGGKFKTRQWNTPKDILGRRFLSDYGLRYDDFYLSLLSSRIRATTSNQEYSPEDNGFSAKEILQNSLETLMVSYLNGHPTENQRMVSQGMNSLVRIASGQSRNDAVASLKTEFGIPVLAYEEYKARNMPTNPNGVLCDGVARVSGKDGTHYGAKKFANNEIEGADVGDIPCYQYDLCVKCKSAQLVDDVHAVYKLISFIDALEDAIHLYPERANVIESRVASFYSKLDTLPESTREKAEEMLDENGRYFMFEEYSSVMQYL